MSAENLLLLVNGADDSTNYAISTTFGTSVQVLRPDDKGGAHQLLNDEGFDSVKDALEAVLNARSEAETVQPLTIKGFKAFGDGRVDIGRAWAINVTWGSKYNVTTEINGVEDYALNKASDLMPMNDVHTAVDLVGFLERVYSENNISAGTKTAAIGIVCDKAQDILTKPFDADKLNLVPKRNRDIER